MDNVNQVLIKYGDQVVEAMRKILISNRKVATGNLVNSLEYRIREGEFQIISTSEHAINVRDGRKVVGWRFRRGVKGSGGESKYIKSIMAWLRVKKVPVGGGKMVAMVKRGKKAPTDQQLLGRAIATANAINKRGIKPLNYTTIPLRILTTNKFKQDILEAIRKDMYKKIINK